MKKTPESVLGIVLNSNCTQVLLVKRKDAGIWVLPGGGVDPQESPEEAIKREIYEETGLQTNIKRKTTLLTPINKLATLTHIYLCERVSGSLRHCEESSDIGFFPIDRLPNPTFYLHKTWLNEALKNKETVQRKMTEVNYLNFMCYATCHPIKTAQFLFTKFSKR